LGRVSAREQQHDRLSLALAAVTCGRLTQAAVVHAMRGGATARADQYGVNVTERELVLEHWGGDAEMLAFDSQLRRAARRSEPGERARVAARTIRDYDLDSLLITFADGGELQADRTELVLRGPPRGRLRRRGVLVHAALGDLL
jgi:hypothetical protein